MSRRAEGYKGAEGLRYSAGIAPQQVDGWPMGWPVFRITGSLPTFWEVCSVWPSRQQADEAAKAYARASLALPRLRREAASAARFRGHRISWGEASSSGSMPWRSVLLGRCRDCGCEVAVDTYPAPNGVAVCGEAFAVECPAKAPPQRSARMDDETAHYRCEA
jgi:hypothetical protein